MKEIFKSKCMLGFLALLIGFLYMNAGSVQKMEESKNNVRAYIAINH